MRQGTIQFVSCSPCKCIPRTEYTVPCRYGPWLCRPDFIFIPSRSVNRTHRIGSSIARSIHMQLHTVTLHWQTSPSSSASTATAVSLHNRVLFPAQRPFARDLCFGFVVTLGHNLRIHASGALYLMKFARPPFFRQLVSTCHPRIGGRGYRRYLFMLCAMHVLILYGIVECICNLISLTQWAFSPAELDNVQRPGNIAFTVLVHFAGMFRVRG